MKQELPYSSSKLYQGFSKGKEFLKISEEKEQQKNYDLIFISIFLFFLKLITQNKYIYKQLLQIQIVQHNSKAFKLLFNLKRIKEYKNI